MIETKRSTEGKFLTGFEKSNKDQRRLIDAANRRANPEKKKFLTKERKEKLKKGLGKGIKKTSRKYTSTVGKVQKNVERIGAKSFKTKLRKVRVGGGKPTLRLNLQPQRLPKERSVFFKVENIK